MRDEEVLLAASLVLREAVSPSSLLMTAESVAFRS
jgi:hypothetical protein